MKIPPIGNMFFHNNFVCFNVLYNMIEYRMVCRLKTSNLEKLIPLLGGKFHLRRFPASLRIGILISLISCVFLDRNSVNSFNFDVLTATLPFTDLESQHFTANRQVTLA